MKIVEKRKDMVISIARQSVILKCMRKKSVMLGNYEFYYAAGLLNNLYNLGSSSDMKPNELFSHIFSKINGITANNPEEEYLLKMIARFEPDESYDDQMVELFQWGESEDKLWIVNPY